MAPPRRSLTPDARLVRADHLRLALEAGRTRVSVEDRSTTAGPLGLAILEAFARPATVQEVVHALGPRAGSAAAWASLVKEISALRDIGALRGEGEPATAGRAAPHPEVPVPPMHVALLDDRVRTEAFVRAIRGTVRPGDVVLDLGTGSGILALAAAKAGARKVYAVEGGPIAEVTERVVRDNGLGERIQVVRGWSQEVTLPERADVLVTETIGHEAFAEGVLGIVADARRRLLKRGARMVPRGVRVRATAAALPATERGRRVYTAAGARRWRRWYDFDFSALDEAARGNPPLHAFMPCARAARLTRLAPAAVVAEADFARDEEGRPHRRRVRVTRAGRLDALVASFDLEVGPGVALATDPWAGPAPTSWLCPVWVLPDPIVVRRGQVLELTAEVDRLHAVPSVALLGG